MNPTNYKLKSQATFSQVWDRGSVFLVFLREGDPMPVLYQIYERLDGHGRFGVITKLTGLRPPADVDVIFRLLEGALCRDPAQLDLARKKWAALEAKIVADVASWSSGSRSAGSAAAAALFSPKKGLPTQGAGPAAASGTAAASSKGNGSPGGGQPPPR